MNLDRLPLGLLVVLTLLMACPPDKPETGLDDSGADTDTDTDADTDTDTDSDADADTDTDTDTTVEVVTDPESGLVWESAAAEVGFVHHEGGANRCASLGAAGRDDWRLPTLSEYADVLGGCDSDVLAGEPGQCTACADSERCAALFPDELTDSAWYWTSTSYATAPNLYAYVGMHDGNIGYVDEDLLNLARCVAP